jgi:DNA-binding PadR family transcriptional regulator
MRRGDVRSALLAVLAEQPMHGYDLIRELEERSGGMWRPSPGSVYPTLQMLEDEGLVSVEERDGKKVYTLTDAGREEVERRKERAGGGAPWDVGEGSERFGDLRDAGFQLVHAAMQVMRTGTAEQATKAAEIMTEARRKIYALLSES